MGNEPSSQQLRTNTAATHVSANRASVNQISPTVTYPQGLSSNGGQLQPVRCPTCHRLLQPPPGHPRFKCPCGQLLAAARPEEQVHVRCPRCQATLQPPPGATLFRCICGAPLRHPIQRDNSARQIRPMDLRSPQNNGVNTLTKGAGKFIDDTILPDEVAAATQIRKPNEEYWIRNTGSDGKLHWVRLLSDEQEKKVSALEQNLHKDIEAKIGALGLVEIKEKLDSIGIDTSEAINREDLHNLFLSAQEILKRKSSKELIKLLDFHNTDYANCVSGEDLATRLVAVGWYGAAVFSDGFVREFVSPFELTVIPAQKYALDVNFSEFKVAPTEIERMSSKSFKEKVKWFRDKCDKSRIRWEDGRVQIKIRRNELLRDSFNNFNRLKPEDLHRYLRFEFLGEEGVDAGGVAREWFELVTDACFNVDCGLFEYSGIDNICYQINPASGIANDLHEQYFHFLGRVVGKALFDHKFIRAHVTQPIYKHILGWPITMKDIEFSDSKLFLALEEMNKAEDVSEYLLTFTTVLEVFGENQEVELKPGGGEIDVTNANLQEYIHLLTKYYMFSRTQVQLAHFLRGIYDVIPPIWLSVFDYRELELLLCGLPNINTGDWKKHTKYRGVYAAKGEKHKVIKWFWDVIEGSSQEQRAMILQFCTGTSRVPVQGFEALQGNDGNIKPFTIDSAKLTDIVYPKAHTCFNRLELPQYKSKEEMIKRFEEALQQGTTGFSDE